MIRMFEWFPWNFSALWVLRLDQRSSNQPALSQQVNAQMLPDRFHYRGINHIIGIFLVVWFFKQEFKVLFWTWKQHMNLSRTGQDALLAWNVSKYFFYVQTLQSWWELREPTNHDADNDHISQKPGIWWLIPQRWEYSGVSWLVHQTAHHADAYWVDSDWPTVFQDKIAQGPGTCFVHTITTSHVQRTSNVDEDLWVKIKRCNWWNCQEWRFADQTKLEMDNWSPPKFGKFLKHVSGHAYLEISTIYYIIIKYYFVCLHSWVLDVHPD